VTLPDHDSDTHFIYLSFRNQTHSMTTSILIPLAGAALRTPGEPAGDVAPITIVQMSIQIARERHSQ
jgi:hypothetical protein